MLLVESVAFWSGDIAGYRVLMGSILTGMVAEIVV
jgi:hypothetical protein